VVGQITRHIVLELTGTPADGKVRRCEVPEDRSFITVHLGGPGVDLVNTGSLHWDGDTPHEIWVPVTAYGEWKLLHQTD
jgi:hypothetical protein